MVAANDRWRGAVALHCRPAGCQQGQPGWLPGRAAGNVTGSALSLRGGSTHPGGGDRRGGVGKRDRIHLVQKAAELPVGGAQSAGTGTLPPRQHRSLLAPCLWASRIAGLRNEGVG